MNLKKYFFLTALLALTGYAVVSRWPGQGPSGLRDAVADNGAIAQLGADSAGADMPAPQPGEAAPVAAEDKLAQAFAKVSADTGAAGDTPFETLADLFDKASPAGADEVIGWHYTLVARSPEKSFFGVSGGALADDGDARKWVRTLHMTYPTGFDLETPVTPKMLESLNSGLEKSPVVVGFPTGEWKKGGNKIAFRKQGNYVIVKHSGIKISGAEPPFDHPVFYVCYVKKI